MKNKQYDDDDGRKIADMKSVNANLWDYWFAPRKKRSDRYTPKHLKQEQNEYVPMPPPTREESRSMMFQAMFASLLIALVFIAGAALFILFCIHIWFK